MKKTILGGTGLIILSLAFSIISWTSPTSTELSKVYKATQARVSKDSLYHQHVSDIYSAAHLEESGLSSAVFEKALTGYYNLKNDGKLSKDKAVLSIADFDQKSTQKRLWIIDLDKKALLLNTWVAHGNGSGGNEATQFSNISNSYQSSLGFYVTGDVYVGKHGRSLRLDGMDKGFNSNARSRAIVIHGADYVSQGTINALGRLGRSQGCPAVAPQYSNLVINATSGKTVLFIHKSAPQYISAYLDHDKAVMYAAQLQQDDATETLAKLDSIDQADTLTAI